MFASRHPKYDTYRPLIGGIFTIEGIIGVGKSTSGRSLERYLNEVGLKTKFYPEYVNETLLTQFINDMPRYAYPFQLIMLYKRLEIYREAESFAKTGGIALIDRSIIGDMTFARMQKAKGNISDEEWQIYLKVMESEKQLRPTASIYLKCSPQTSLTRVRTRGLEAEIAGYTSEYMIELHSAYEASMTECTNVTHVMIDWETPVEMVDGYLTEPVLDSILTRLL